MKVLVANLGSTSFKYRLYDLPSEVQLARGGIDRIGQSASACFVEIHGNRQESTLPVGDHAAAVGMCLDTAVSSPSVKSPRLVSKRYLRAT